MTIFGCDVAGYQGLPNWQTVKASGISFALSKVTQSTNYVNPSWSHNLSGMLALGDGFVPGAYHFLQQGTDPVAQARYFFAHLGGHEADLAVALDVEPTTGSRPSASQARAWVKEFKRLANNHPVIGYFPGWYWSEIGNPDLSFFDTLWQSHYVTDTGSPAHIFGSAPASWWAGYGGEQVSILQYTDKASVPGITGVVDANAFKGTVADLRALALGTSQPAPQPNIQEDDMPYGIVENGTDPKTCLTAGALPKGRYKTIGFNCDNGKQGLLPASMRVALAWTDDKGVSHWEVHDNVVVDSSKGQTVLHLPAGCTGFSVVHEDAAAVKDPAKVDVVGAVNVAYEIS